MRSDDALEEWVNNDEGLYLMYIQSGLTMKQFIRKFRGQIDEVSDNVKSGRKRPDYLVYGD